MIFVNFFFDNQKLERRMLIFFLREKKRDCSCSSFWEKGKSETRVIKKVFLIILSKQRVWGNLGTCTPVMQESENRHKDHGLRLIMTYIVEMCGLHASRGISKKLFLLKLNFELIYVMWYSFYMYVLWCHIKCLYNFFFFVLFWCAHHIPRADWISPINHIYK